MAAKKKETEKKSNTDKVPAKKGGAGSGVGRLQKAAKAKTKAKK